MRYYAQAVKPKGRGILEHEEVDRLFSIPWRDERSRLVNLIASQTGMRMGEIRALRICDILIDRIRVSHAWSYADGGSSVQRMESVEKSHSSRI